MTPGVDDVKLVDDCDIVVLFAEPYISKGMFIKFLLLLQ